MRVFMISMVSCVASTARVAGARVVAMAVRDDGAIDRARRIDEESAGLAIEPAVGRIQPFVDAGSAHAHLSGDAPNVVCTRRIRQTFR